MALNANVTKQLAAKDLSAAPPAAPTAAIDGYVWLPRLLDKARATLAGTAGEYSYPCPIDLKCLARLGVTPELVSELAARHADDGAVLEALRAHGIPAAADAWFDPEAV